MIFNLRKLNKYINSHSFLTLCLVSFIAFNAHGHNGHPNKAPWHACEEKKLSDLCSYQTESTLYKGTCRTIKAELLCVRNQPLESIKQSAKEDTKTNILSKIFKVKTYDNILANVKN
ncbi:hypothetical protein [Paraglaciecola sp. L3A3]|uniref:hypothetical protein n=1 Tax=Paraglaciecola sp. L3A3 TaxID=2686358 RepID=UPI00131D8867|nr:hypothetical protein [Paraglaciecola sp. L3A3]